MDKRVHNNFCPLFVWKNYK